MLRHRPLIVLLVAVVILIFAACRYNDLPVSRLDYQNIIDKFDPAPECKVPRLISSQDQNRNGTPDALDIVEGARQEVRRGTVYDSSYFQEGYPPGWPGGLYGCYMAGL